MKEINIGMLGFGTVGGGTWQVLQRNAEEISRRVGGKLQIKQIAVRDLSKPRAIDAGDIQLTDDAMRVVNDPEIDIVVELIGGVDAAKHCVLQALENRKHVVTANKALIALHGNEIFAKAQSCDMTVAFESAVAGGIPVIKSIREGLAANRITSIAGIINGTCNYILTRMQEGADDFQAALAQAQTLGYAEEDPSFDIDGVDAAHKLTILASIAFGVPLQFDKVHVEGIAEISGEDIAYCADLGYRIKHLGIAKRGDAGIELRVHPTLVPHARMLANVDGVMNAVLVHADAVGPTLYYGAGAGALPTASAVVADLVDVARAMTSDPANRVPSLAFHAGALADAPVLDMESVQTAYYLKLSAANRPGVLAQVTKIFGDNQISIDSIIQKGRARTAQADTAKVVMLTHPTIERDLNRAKLALAKLDLVHGEIVSIRKEDFL